ncbi:transglutaminase-like domain-containing protein [Patescibacteria group bacterium]|nr:transglutaminase-like domain-containing protein [Patescibacteria group bacterium]MBU2068367.1 transglutaminase-like domain-containing protein [Patescibacteria group bacterium]
MQNYIKDTEQIKITGNIKNIADNFKEKDLDLILEICNWIFNNFKNIENDKEEKMKLFRKRTADEIIESKKLTGCTDYAIVFIALARAKEIPTKYIEAIRKRWLDIGDQNHIEGHIFVECLIGNKWYIIDPQEGAIRTDYRKYAIFKKGLDSWGIGIRNFDDLKGKFLEFKEEYKSK